MGFPRKSCAGGPGVGLSDVAPPIRGCGGGGQEAVPQGRRQGEAAGPTHVPGADEDGDHVGLRLLRVLVFHLLQELAEAFSLLRIEG